MLRKSNTINWHHAGNALTKAAIQYCLLPLLVIFLPAANLAISWHDSFDSGFRFQQAHYSYHLPFVSDQVEGELEISEEEDKETDSFSGNDLLSPPEHLSVERHYSRLIRNRLIRISTSLKQQKSPPLFILHHSWKGFLS
ncbi:hypothetical protein MD537_15310 [Flavihumibacter sediminis]|nr:hypothetical protein [Flavihumibacter sediminis]